MYANSVRLKILQETSYYDTIELSIDYINKIKFCALEMQIKNDSFIRISDEHYLNASSTDPTVNKNVRLIITYRESTKKYSIMFRDDHYLSTQYKLEDKDTLINILEFLHRFDIPYNTESKKVITNLKLNLL